MNAELVTCTQCGAERARGVVHRCAAPDLITFSPAAERVIAACRDAGGRPLVVGGSVRDALMGCAADQNDLDIEVHGLADFGPLQREIGKIGWVDLAGAAYGVLKAVVDHEDFDIALPPAVVGASDPLRASGDVAVAEVEAAARRDFTINAMAFDPLTQELVDPWGGAADLAAGELRHTSDSFADDPLRVMRAVQLSARFGFTLAPDTAALCRSLADEFDRLPRERVWAEWRKIARQGRHFSHALRVLVETGWLRHFPALADTVGVEQDEFWHPEGDVFTHLGLAADEATSRCSGLPAEDREVAVLGSLLHDVGKSVTTERSVAEDGTARVTSQGHAEAGVPIARRFLVGIGAPGHIVARVLPIIREHMCHVSITGAPSVTAVRRLMRRLADGNSGATIHDWARVVDADCAGRGAGAKPSSATEWLAVAERIGPTARPSILTGAHLIAAGWMPGPDFRTVIRAATAAQDDGVIVDEASALEWFAQHGEKFRTSS